IFISIISASLAWACELILRKETDYKKSLALAFGVTCVISVISLLPRPPLQHQEMKVLLIQANIGNYDKYLAERLKDVRPPILDKYARLTDLALKESGPVDLIVWPETAIPDNMDDRFLNGKFQQTVLDHVRRWKTRLISGAYAEDFEEKVYNAIVNISPEGVVQQMYKKRHLLAFGEYFPGAETFPFLKKLVPAVSDFGAGKEDVIFVTEKARIALQICYEGLYPLLTRTPVMGGADAIINVTNDSWFGQTFEPYQHLTMTLARAVEFQIPLIRSTNTGMTTTVTPQGEFLLDSPLHREWATSRVVHIPLGHQPTIFTKILPWLNGIFLGFLILISLIAFVKSRLPGSK
ncbi:MAG: apolipoprotein N-acyltransferase, partial [Bdellovibrionales bacterium]|nr:apolipoprotein N-acyltransferase [Bdellovibrionales bacterium]